MQMYVNIKIAEKKKPHTCLPFQYSLCRTSRISRLFISIAFHSFTYSTVVIDFHADKLIIHLKVNSFLSLLTK